MAWNLMAILLLLRSLAREPANVPDWQIAAIAMIFITIAGIGRWRLRKDINSQAIPKFPGLRWVSYVFTPGAVVLTLWLSTLQPNMIAALFIWMALLASEGIWAAQCCLFEHAPQAMPLPSQAERTMQKSADIESLDDNESPPLDDDVDQRIERRIVAGVVEVRGLLRVRYKPGQRIANVFAGFVPPLIPSPRAEGEAIWGSEATVSVADIHAQGIELELRREAVDDGEESTIVEFYARASDRA